MSQESEVISLDAGLRMDGTPALDFIGCGDRNVTFTLRIQSSPTQEAAENRLRNSNPKPERKGNRDVDELPNVDHVVANASSSQGESQVVHFLKTLKR